MSEAVEQDFKVIGTRPVRPDGVDKVTGRAAFGADLSLPGMLQGVVLRSPHAHARIKSIDTSKAEALEGVSAVVTGADFPSAPETADPALSVNVMARDKVLYHGHAVAAVAAASAAIGNAAIALIEVEYEVLKPVLSLDEAMADGATIIDEKLRTAGADEASDARAEISEL